MTNDKIISGEQLWQWYQSALAAAKLSDVPLGEVDWILQEIAGLDRLALRLESFKTWPQIQLKLSLFELNNLWQCRLQERLPVQYITGVTHWRNFSLVVSPVVLIPRPETECLIDLAVKAVSSAPLTLCPPAPNIGGDSPLAPNFGGGSPPAPKIGGGSPLAPHPPISPSLQHWADLGTGSGVIAIGLADVFPNAIIYAVDKSADALAIAQQNALRQGFADRINFAQGSWFEPLEKLRGKLKGMISNPPYIPSSMVPTLQPEVTKHEPHLALDGGSDGLECIRHLIETAPDYLLPGGIWLIEMMAGQAEKVAELLRLNGNYREIQIFSDLEGIQRFALAYRC